MRMRPYSDGTEHPLLTSSWGIPQLGTLLPPTLFDFGNEF